MVKKKKKMVAYLQHVSPPAECWAAVTSKAPLISEQLSSLSYKIGFRGAS